MNESEKSQTLSSVPDGSCDAVNAPKVIDHYRSLIDVNLAERTESRIFHLRNLNNWMKAMLIAECSRWLGDSDSAPPAKKRWQGDSDSAPSAKRRMQETTVLDMCGGKGGDLLKWKKSSMCPSHVVLVDLAPQCVEQARERYFDMKAKSRFERHGPPLFSAEFVAADCTRHTLAQILPQPDMRFDVVSVQFSLHYTFESQAQATQMLRNISEALKPGGIFIGTTPDANEIVKRARTQLRPDGSFGNEVYRLQFSKPLPPENEPLPLFGCEYTFQLDDVVNCPEYLVYFPLLRKMCEEVGLDLVARYTFEDFYEAKRGDGRTLLGHMQCLETFPPFQQTANFATKAAAGEYRAAEELIRRHGRSQEEIHVGTLSQSEWDVFRLYIAFAFRKRSQDQNE